MTEVIELVRWTLDGKAISVPHDAMLGEKRSPNAPTGSAGAYFNGGTYTYECCVDVPEGWANKHVLLELEGVMGRTRVFANKRLVASHAYGYTGFVVSLTKEAVPGEQLCIQVQANNADQPSSRWYAGSGMYRPARLVIKDKSCIAWDGVTITTEHIYPAQLRVQTEVVGEGTPYVRIERDGVAVAGKRGSDVRLNVPNARLWSAEHPYRYVCHVMLRADDGDLLDEVRVPFGIRKLDWNEEGLFVNGSPVKLRGGCLHHDNGILGAADLAEASRRKVAILKRWGFNAIRSAHNPISKSMLDACDELGMYVMDEYADMWYRHKNPYDYAADFELCHAEDLQAMIQKDRSHPSVIMYSIGNENAEPHEELGVLTARLLANIVRRADPTRPVTAGVNATILFAAGLGIDSFNGGENNDDGVSHDGLRASVGSSPNKTVDTSLAYNTYVAKMGDVMELLAGSWPVGRAVEPFLNELDVAGYNYGTKRYLPDLRKHPERLVFGSETMPYDLVRNWRLVESDPRIVGDFMWTCWDYLGECSLAAWSDDPTPVSKPYPWLVADTGALDLLGDPNGEAALAKTVWCDPQEPLLFVRPADLPNPHKGPWRGTNSVPCWSWRGCEGNMTTAEIYTQAPIAKLYLNGRHVGTKRVRDCHADFRLRYEPGELVAVACNASGLELGRSSLVSAQGQLGLRLSLERRDGNVAFVRVDATDAESTVEGTFNDEVCVSVVGGELLAFGSAAQKSECSYLGGKFPLRYGRGLAVVRTNDGSEPCVIEARSAGAGDVAVGRIRI